MLNKKYWMKKTIYVSNFANVKDEINHYPLFEKEE